MSKITFSFKAVGKTIDITFYETELSSVQLVLSDIEQEIARLQNIFNYYNSKSELSQLNLKRKLNGSIELREVLGLAIKGSELTKGKYDVSKGKEFIARKDGKEIVVQCSYKNILVTKETIELTHSDVSIDLSSLAKGYIVDKLCAFLEQLGFNSVLVDARGDMRIFGAQTEIIGIQHPRDMSKELGEFEFKDLAVATSGDYLQFVGDYSKSHIIHDTDAISVTVSGKSAMVCDFLASLYFVSNIGGRRKIHSVYKQYSCIIVRVTLELESYGDFFNGIK